MPRLSRVAGQSLTALCAGALALNVLLVLGVLAILAVEGLGHFWQRDLLELRLEDGTVWLAELHGRETPEVARADDRPGEHWRLRTANRRLDGVANDFRRIDVRRINSVSRPTDAVAVERLEWGPFFGRLVDVRSGTGVDARGEAAWRLLRRRIREKQRERRTVEAFARDALGRLNDRRHELERTVRRLERKATPAHPRETELELARDEMRRVERTLELESNRLLERRAALLEDRATFHAADGRTLTIAIADIVRAVRPNAMGTPERIGLYLERAWEFVVDAPRESNTEGGIFPAIFGTVLMVILMSVAVGPFGVLAAVYLREYAGSGPVVRVVRIAVNNLAGVPSIVFGVFGLGFFVYAVGGNIDRLFFPDRLPAPTFGTGGILWASLTLALLTLPVVIVATEEGLAAVPRAVREGSMALGANKSETTFRIVVPAAAPGMLTGLILATARAAGEVAPLMIVGMVKLAVALPVDRSFPFIHPERKFMHLGFHIYDVGLQSPNVEATRPLVFCTALLLVGVVTAMNIVAILLRNRLRARYRTAGL